MKKSYPYKLTHLQWLSFICYQGGMNCNQAGYSLGILPGTHLDRLKDGRRKGAPLRFKPSDTKLRESRKKKFAKDPVPKLANRQKKKPIGPVPKNKTSLYI